MNEREVMSATRAQQAAMLRVLLPLICIWLLNGLYLGPLARTSLALFWFVDLVTWIGLPAAAFLYLRRHGVHPHRYGLRGSALTWTRFAGVTLLVFLTTRLAFVWTRRFVWEALGRPPSLFAWPNTFPEHEVWNLVAVWYTSFTAGLVESIMYIGLPWALYSSLRSAPSRWAFAAFISLVFGFGHWEQGVHIIAGAFVTNLIGCAWYFRTGTLWPVIVAHTLSDVLSFS